MARKQLSALFLLFLLVGSQAAQLSITSVSIGGLNRDIAGGPSFIDVKPNGGPNQDAYEVQLGIKNTGKDATIQSVDVRVYVGSYTDKIPQSAKKLQIDTTSVRYKHCIGAFWRSVFVM